MTKLQQGKPVAAFLGLWLSVGLLPAPPAWALRSTAPVESGLEAELSAALMGGRSVNPGRGTPFSLAAGGLEADPAVFNDPRMGEIEARVMARLSDWQRPDTAGTTLADRVSAYERFVTDFAAEWDVSVEQKSYGLIAFNQRHFGDAKAVLSNIFRLIRAGKPPYALGEGGGFLSKLLMMALQFDVPNVKPVESPDGVVVEYSPNSHLYPTYLLPWAVSSLVVGLDGAVFMGVGFTAYYAVMLKTRRSAEGHEWSHVVQYTILNQIRTELGMEEGFDQFYGSVPSSILERPMFGIHREPPTQQQLQTIARYLFEDLKGLAPKEPAGGLEAIAMLEPTETMLTDLAEFLKEVTTEHGAAETGLTLRLPDGRTALVTLEGMDSRDVPAIAAEIEETVSALTGDALDPASQWAISVSFEDMAIDHVAFGAPAPEGMEAYPVEVALQRLDREILEVAPIYFPEETVLEYTLRLLKLYSIAARRAGMTTLVHSVQGALRNGTPADEDEPFAGAMLAIQLRQVRGSLPGELAAEALQSVVIHPDEDSLEVDFRLRPRAAGLEYAAAPQAVGPVAARSDGVADTFLGELFTGVDAPAPIVIGSAVRSVYPELENLRGLEGRGIFLEPEEDSGALLERLARSGAKRLVYVGLPREREQFSESAGARGIDVSLVDPARPDFRGLLLALLSEATGLEEAAIAARSGFESFMQTVSALPESA
ncbi:MAG: hypothetical protein COV76_07630 [Candidatus Omnitrophica bacterium CG11_big_fil_rev_8_21_14_0_20_64_10]|nr:MAG: hypothetical protein COV76_07630 [Candidatus Omnitrophica bacterium CG11_big_fil_rev_8_21_14_0_20_64_10]